MKWHKLLDKEFIKGQRNYIKCCNITLFEFFTVVLKTHEIKHKIMIYNIISYEWMISTWVIPLFRSRYSFPLLLYLNKGMNTWRSSTLPISQQDIRNISEKTMNFKRMKIILWGTKQKNWLWGLSNVCWHAFECTEFIVSPNRNGLCLQCTACHLNEIKTMCLMIFDLIRFISQNGTIFFCNSPKKQSRGENMK